MAQGFGVKRRAEQAALAARRAENMRRSPTGQVLETYRPDTVAGDIYDVIGRMAGGVRGLFGGSEDEALRTRMAAERKARDVGEFLVGPEEVERSARRVYAGQGAPGDYATLAITALPFAPKAVKQRAVRGGKALLGAVERSVPERIARFMAEPQGVRSMAAVPARAAAPRPVVGPAAASLAAQPSEVGRTAYGTYELVPYAYGGHRTDVGPEASLAAREMFTSAPETSWTNEGGTDVIYDVMGMPQASTVRTTGVYTPPVEGALPESNPGRAARVLLGTEGGRPTAEEAASMTGGEAVRAAADVQGAGAWSMPLLGVPPEEAGAMFVPTGSPAELNRILELQRLGGSYGLPDVVDLGEGILRTNFGGLPSGTDLQRLIRAPGGLSGGNPAIDVRRVLGPQSKPMLVGTTGDYVGFEDAWGAPQGTGAVTRQLEQYLGNVPTTRREALLEDPRIAQAFGQRFLRDEAARQIGLPVRADVQRSREMIAEDERLQALIDALRRGLPVMAEGGLVAGHERQ